MIDSTVLNELAKRLSPEEDGNCFIDSKCYFGIGVKKCSAPKAYILKQHKDAESRQASDNGAFGIQSPGDINADWPCSFFIEIKFVDPDSQKQNDRPTSI